MSKILAKNNIKSYSEDVLSTAVELLSKNDLVAFPTETVYGLGADATSDTAVSQIYKLKNRPFINPLITHVSNEEMAYSFCKETQLSNILAKAFWPGPLTIIMEQKNNTSISKLAAANLDSIAVRVPKSKILQNIISKLNKPIAAPSANKSGMVSPTSAEHVFEEFGEKIKLIIDNGQTEKGIESTVVDARGDCPVILRPGPITLEMIQEATNSQAKLNTSSELIESPGQLLKHYSTQKHLIINSTNCSNDCAYLGFKNLMPNNKFNGVSLNLSKKGNLNEAAANLFSMLRTLDKSDAKNIMVAPIPNKGIGVAINDRLKRAAL